MKILLAISLMLALADAVDAAGRLHSLQKTGFGSDLEAIDRLLAKCDDFHNHKSPWGSCDIGALTVAAYQGNIGAVVALLEDGVDPNLEQTSLMSFSYFDTMAILLENYYDYKIMVKFLSNVPPLHVAAYRGHADVVTVLLERGADPNLTTPNQVTPLHVAASQGHDRIVTALLRAGSDPNLRTMMVDYSRTVVRGGLHIGYEMIDDATPLHWAARKDRTGAVIALLEGGADLNIMDSKGQTPLLVATRFSQANTITALLEAGADANMADKRGNTPLHWLLARSGGHGARLASALLEAGADLTAVNSEGATPLHIAATRFCTGRLIFCDDGSDEIEVLLEAGARADVKDFSGRTPLDVAIKHGYSAAIVTLREQGVTPP